MLKKIKNFFKSQGGDPPPQTLQIFAYAAFGAVRTWGKNDWKRGGGKNMILRTNIHP